MLKLLLFLLLTLATSVQQIRKTGLHRILAEVTSNLKELESLPSLDVQSESDYETEHISAVPFVSSTASVVLSDSVPIIPEVPRRLLPLVKKKLTFTSKQGPVRFDFLSDFSRGYTRATERPKPKAVLVNNSYVILPENWTIARTPEDERRELELSLANLTNSMNLNRTGLNLSKYDELGLTGARAAIMLSKLENLMSVQSAENTPRLVKDAFHALHYYGQLKNQLLIES